MSAATRRPETAGDESINSSTSQSTAATSNTSQSQPMVSQSEGLAYPSPAPSSSISQSATSSHSTSVHTSSVTPRASPSVSIATGGPSVASGSASSPAVGSSSPSPAHSVQNVSMRNLMHLPAVKFISRPDLFTLIQNNAVSIYSGITSEPPISTVQYSVLVQPSIPIISRELYFISNIHSTTDSTKDEPPIYTLLKPPYS